MNRVFASLFLGIGLLSSLADAAISYELFFRSPSFADGSSAIIPETPGQVFSGVGIFLRETVTGGDSSFLAASNVNGYNFGISVSGSDGSFANYVSDTTGGFDPRPVPDPNFIVFSAFGPIFGSPGKAPVSVGAGVSEIRLGQVDLIAPNAGATTFTIERANGGAPGSLVTFAGPVLPQNGGVFTNASLTVTAIPEPSSIALLAGLGAFGAFRLHRKRKLAKTGDV